VVKRTLGGIVLWLIASLAPAVAAELLPRSVLILDQNEADTAWYEIFSATFRATLNLKSAAPISVYAEHLDLSRFQGPPHDDVLRTYLRDKFRNSPIGVIVVQGTGALDFITRSRDQLWPDVSLVFVAMDDATTIANLPSNFTGTTYQFSFGDLVASARMLARRRESSCSTLQWRRTPVRGSRRKSRSESDAAIRAGAVGRLQAPPRSGT